MFIKIREEDYYYSIFSDDPVKPYLVMLHGFMGDSRSFNHLLEPLSQFCNPITIDLLGHGSTNAPLNPDRYNFLEQLADLRTLFAELNLPPFFMHGYSMGGRLAIQFAVNYSDFLSGLILESTTFGIDDEEDIKSRLAEDKRRAESIEQNYRQFVEDWNNAPLFKNKSEDSSERNQSLKKIQKNQKPHGLANSLRGFGTASMPSVKNQLQKIKCPVLLLSGAEDAKFSRIGKEMLEHINHSTHYIIGNSNHRVHIDNPDSYLQHIKTFISMKQIG
ncbi:MAG TPA: 2-succinyl-6-hydroxy-2,4-cyclohexadiene-1-carboxylate synthase [Balneolales bacterium]|nr:2-succinyl-6-hydroxy-2,4-cyclohexadiene-1-carboxylate synthase [Balneolales bacterium]